MTIQQTAANSPRTTTVMVLAVSPAVAATGEVFAVTSEGLLWRSTNLGAAWTQVALPGSGLAMSVALGPSFERDGHMWVSLAEGVFAWSTDGGKTWRDGYTTRQTSPAVVLAVSPAAATDNLALAATTEDGILRSMDRGRTWSPANFGLLDLKTLALAICPSFASEQVALVGTETALYRSRNGGLSWKEVSFAEDAVQALAFSADFGSDRCAWAGTEGKGLLVSRDGGLTWQTAENFPTVSINVLTSLKTDRSWLLAGTVQGIHASKDSGKTWKQALPEVNVLALAAAGGVAIAATEANGLYVSSGKLDKWASV